MARCYNCLFSSSYYYYFLYFARPASVKWLVTKRTIQLYAEGNCSCNRSMIITNQIFIFSHVSNSLNFDQQRHNSSLLNTQYTYIDTQIKKLHSSAHGFHINMQCNLLNFFHWFVFPLTLTWTQSSGSCFLQCLISNLTLTQCKPSPRCLIVT